MPESMPDATPVPERLRALAQELLRARQGGPGADAQHWASAIETPQDAYRVQALVLGALDGHAGPHRHWKSGGPSRDAVLTHAPLPAAGVWASPADGRTHPFRLRLIEAEVALRLGRDVDAAQAAALTPQEAPRWVDAMAVSIEVVDLRWQQGTQAPALAKLADLQAHGALVLGEWRPFEPRDWAAQACTVQIGQGEPARFRGTHSLGDPTWLLPTWLRHLTREGGTVPRGTVVTTGTWCGMLPAQAGDRVQVRFEGIGEASVQL